MSSARTGYWQKCELGKKTPFYGLNWQAASRIPCVSHIIKKCSGTMYEIKEVSPTSGICTQNDTVSMIWVMREFVWQVRQICLNCVANVYVLIIQSAIVS